MARRPRSLALSFTENATTADGPILRTEVLTALIDLGVKKEEVDGIEAPQRHKYFVVFKEQPIRSRFIGKTITIRDTHYKLEHPNPTMQTNPKKRLKIYQFPLDEDTSHLEKTLQHYGNFTPGSIRDLEDRACGLKNGIKEVYIQIKKSIPSYVYVGKNLVRFDYVGQLHTCRKCHQTGHFARECTTTVTCRGCGGNDHNRYECPHVICFQCGKEGHTATNCFQYAEEFPDLTGEKKTEEPWDDTTNFEMGNYGNEKAWGESTTTTGKTAVNSEKEKEKEKEDDMEEDNINEFEMGNHGNEKAWGESTTPTGKTTVNSEKEKEKEKEDDMEEENKNEKTDKPNEDGKGTGDEGKKTQEEHPPENQDENKPTEPYTTTGNEKGQEPENHDENQEENILTETCTTTAHGVGKEPEIKNDNNFKVPETPHSLKEREDEICDSTDENSSTGSSTLAESEEDWQTVVGSRKRRRKRKNLVAATAKGKSRMVFNPPKKR